MYYTPFIQIPFNEIYISIRGTVIIIDNLVVAIFMWEYSTYSIEEGRFLH